IGPFIDGARPGPDFFVGEERHGACTVWPMALLAAPLQDRFDIFREGDIAGSACLRGCGGGYKESSHGGGEPSERTSHIDFHCTLPGLDAGLVRYSSFGRANTPNISEVYTRIDGSGAAVMPENDYAKLSFNAPFRYCLAISRRARYTRGGQS